MMSLSGHSSTVSQGTPIYKFKYLSLFVLQCDTVSTQHLASSPLHVYSCPSGFKGKNGHFPDSFPYRVKDSNQLHPLMLACGDLKVRPTLLWAAQFCFGVWLWRCQSEGVLSCLISILLGVRSYSRLQQW